MLEICGIVHQLDKWCDGACSSGGELGAPPLQICPQHHANSLINAQQELALAFGQQAELHLKLMQANTDVLVPLPSAADVMSGDMSEDSKEYHIFSQQFSQAILKRNMAKHSQTALTGQVQAGKDLVLRLSDTLHVILAAAAEDAYTP